MAYNSEIPAISLQSTINQQIKNIRMKKENKVVYLQPYKGCFNSAMLEFLFQFFVKAV